MRGRPVKSILCIVAAVLLVSGTAHAAADVGTVDQMIQQLQTHVEWLGAALRGLALNSFYILGVIDIALTAIGWAFRGGDLGDLLSSLVSEIMFLGIFLALLQNSVSWSQDIVSSFRQGAAAAGATAVTPGDVVLAGVNIAQQVMSVSAWSHPIAFVAFMIAEIVIDICFARACHQLGDSGARNRVIYSRSTDSEVDHAPPRPARRSMGPDEGPATRQ